MSISTQTYHKSDTNIEHHNRKLKLTFDKRLYSYENVIFEKVFNPNIRHPQRLRPVPKPVMGTTEVSRFYHLSNNPWPSSLSEPDMGFGQVHTQPNIRSKPVNFAARTQSRTKHRDTALKTGMVGFPILQIKVS